MSADLSDDAVKAALRDEVARLTQELGNARIELAEARNERNRLREACNKARLALAGYVGRQIGIDAIDNAVGG